MKCMTTARLLTLLAVTRLAAAIVVPESLPDGIWTISFDPATEAIQPSAASPFQRLATDPGAAIARLARRQNKPPPLENPRPTCGNYDLSRDAFDAAKEVFEGICESDKQYQTNFAVVVSSQGSIAYMCNFNGGNRCWREEYEEASQIMDRQCGNRRVASVYVERWKKAYGRDVVGADICR